MKSMRTSGLGRGLYLCRRGVWLPGLDVLSYGSVEQPGLLGHEATRARSSAGAEIS